MNILYNTEKEAEEFYQKVAQNIKVHREKLKMPQLEFAQSVGFKSVSFYCDCENGKNGKHFNLLHVVRIAHFLNIDVNDLIK